MLKELKAHHRNIIQMSFNGFKNAEIAERLGMTQSTVSLIINSQLGKAYLSGLQDKAQKNALDVRKELISMNKDALNTFKRLLDPKAKTPAAVQYNTAKDVLDRTGYKASDKIDFNFTLKNKSDEELEAEINAIEESINRQQNNLIKEASSEEIISVENVSEDEEIEKEEKIEEEENSSLSDKIQSIIKETYSGKEEFDPFKNID